LISGRGWAGPHPPASKTGRFLACSLFSSSLVFMVCSRYGFFTLAYGFSILTNPKKTIGNNIE
jgi:hypothetical protein